MNKTFRNRLIIRINPQSTKAYDLYEYALRKKYKNEDPRGTFAQASDNYKAEDLFKMACLNNFNNGLISDVNLKIRYKR